jgi:hypothetical protein
VSSILFSFLSSRGFIVCPDHGDVLAVWDFRSSAARTLTILTGYQRLAYLFCDQNRPLPQIRSFLADTEPAYEAELLAFLEKLVRERLMLSIDGRYLSLAVRAPDTPVHELPERRSAGQATFLVHQD